MLVTTDLNEAIKEALIKYNHEELNEIITVYFRHGEAYLNTASAELYDGKNINKYCQMLKNCGQIIDALNDLKITINYGDDNEHLTATEYEELTTAIYNSLTGKNIKNDLTEVISHYEVKEA